MSKYCQLALVRYQPWRDQHSNAWDGIADDEGVKALWKAFVEGLDQIGFVV